MCFPVKGKSEKQQKIPLLLVRYELSPCHIYHGQRQHFSIIRSQVQHFSGFGKTQKSYSEVQSLRCVLPLLPVLHRLLHSSSSVYSGSETAQSKGKEYENFSMGSYSFFTLHLSNTNWKHQKFWLSHFTCEYLQERQDLNGAVIFSPVYKIPSLC